MSTIADLFVTQYSGIEAFLIGMAVGMFMLAVGFVGGFFIGRNSVPRPPHPTNNLEVTTEVDSSAGRQREVPIHSGGVRTGQIYLPK